MEIQIDITTDRRKERRTDKEKDRQINRELREFIKGESLPPYRERCLIRKTIKQLFLSVEQLDQLEVHLPYNRLLSGMPIPAVFLNLLIGATSIPSTGVKVLFWP